MDSSRSSFDPDVLLAHAGWLRALAHSLLPSDAHLADDVAQEACLAALAKTPKTDRPLGAWLATVVKNLVRQSRRGTLRRTSHEQSAAVDERLPSTLDHVEKLSVHRALVEAVMALDEPYRETIVLRFFEELSPSSIARRQSVPVATVKTRLARGLEKLRARLDRDHGSDGRSWILALIPVARPTLGLSTSTLGALIVDMNIKLAIGAAVIACGAFALWFSKESPAAAVIEELASGPSVASPPAETDVGAGALPPADAERTAAFVPAPANAPEITAPVLARRLRGHVVDLMQRPLSGLRVRFHAGARETSVREFNIPQPVSSADSPAAITGGVGEFELPLPQREGELVVEDPRWTTVLSSLCGPASESEHMIVVAPRLEHAGVVIDEAGQPLANARIEIRLPRDLRVAFSRILDNSAERGWVALSDGGGRFELAEAPLVDGALLLAWHEGHATLSQPAPDSSDLRLVLTMRQPRAENGMFAGQVVDERGTPTAGARVSLGHGAPVISGADGVFLIAIPEEGPREPWIAVKQGHQPAIVEPSASVKHADALNAEFAVLRLGPAPLSIAGRVVDDEGRPKSGIKVFITDPTFFGAFDEIPMHIEGMLSGAATRADLEQLMANAPAGSDPEALLKETSNVLWTFVRTDAGGNFRIEGLIDREYRLAALEPETLLRVDGDPIRAGSANALLLLPKGAYFETLRGRVVTRDGRPVAGVKLSPNVDVLSVAINEQSRSTIHVDARSVVSDAEGRFSFQRIPRQHVYLALTGEGILPLDWCRKQPGGIEAAVGDPLEEIAIEVKLRHHLQVEVAPELADEARVLDSRGIGMMLNVFEGNSSMSTGVLAIVDGRSKVMVVGEEARTLVLLKANQEVARIPLALVQGELNVVRF